MSVSPYNVSDLVEQLGSASKNIGIDDGEARRQCLNVARSLVSALETPSEAIFRHAWSEQTHLGVLLTGIDLKLFERLDDRDGDVKSSTELAAVTGADPVLMEHILKHLAAMGTIYEAGPNKYVPTPLSHALTVPINQSPYAIMHRAFSTSALAIPEFLSKNGYKYPDNPLDTPFQLGYHEKESFFSYVSQDPDRLRHFQQHLESKSWAWPNYLEDEKFIQENLVAGAETGGDAVFLVDSGGGKGHDLQDLSKKYPRLPGKLVLQDLPDVIKEAKSSGLGESIVLMEHDFFTAQPVKGARAYYFRSVLHDWADPEAREILLRVKDAMKPGYSKLLVNERIITSTGAHWLITGIDILMMALFGAKERTEDDWERLFESAGLKIVENMSFEPASESLMVVELA